MPTYAVRNAEADEQTLFPSPRNSVEGSLALMEYTSCSVLISPVESKVDHILSKRGMRHLNVEGLKELLGGDAVEHYEYKKTFKEAAQDPFIVVHARIGLDHFLFTKPSKPMLRTDKGTVKRRATNQAYEKEIDELYADVAGFGQASDAVQLNPRDSDALRIAIHNMLTKIEGLQKITFDQDLFAAGMDSLQVMNLVRQLRSSFRDYDGGAFAHLISPRTIYSNPNVFKIVTAVKYLADNGEAASESLAKERIDNMEGMLAKYSHDLPQNKRDVTQIREQGLTVVLTGSTGSLGSYILDCLLANAQVAKVICLNRGADSEIKQKNGNNLRGLVNEWKDRALFLTTDLSRSDLGLGPDEYQLDITLSRKMVKAEISKPINAMTDSILLSSTESSVDDRRKRANSVVL